MLNFIIGRKNSGKTAAAHKILGEKVAEGRETMLIVPRQYTFESDRGILSLLGPKAASRVEVLSFTRLSHIALSLYGGIKKPVASGAARLIYMSLAIDSLSDRLRVFSRHKNDIALSSKLLSFVDEMKNEGITADELEKSAGSLTDRLLREKAEEAALIYRTYEAVVAQSAFDDADLLSRVYDILCGEDFFCGKTVVIDGFPSFTCDELKLISLMMRQAEEVYVTLCLDKTDITAKTGPFPYIQRTARKLMKLAGEYNIGVCEPVVCTGESGYFREDIAHIEKNLYKPDFAVYEGKADNVTVITAKDFYDECDAVARKIKALIRQGDYRCRDIAVVYRDGESYERQLRHSFITYGIPFFEDKRQDIIRQPLIILVSALLKICGEGFDSDYVFRYLKTYLTGISDEESALMENYCFMWDISGKKWLSEWSYNPDGFGESLTEKRQQELKRLNGLRERAVSPVLSLRERLLSSDASEAIRAIYVFLRENGIDKALKEYALALEKEGETDLALEQEQVWDILMEAFDDMAGALGGRRISPKRLSELFELVISEKSLGKLPDGFDEVSVADAERMLTKRAKVVFAVGLNSGLFPKTQTESGLFSAFEKSRIESTGLSLGDGVKEKSLRERFILYNALSSASDRLYLSYCVSGQGDEKMSKSEAVTLCEKMLPSLKSTVTGNERLIDLIESEKSAFRLMAERYREDSSQSNTLYSYFAGKKEYRAVLDSMSRAIYKEPYEIEDKETALSLFGKDLYFSASQMETYSKCPFMYYCRYGIGASPRVKARLDASQSGTVVHHVLEIILKKYRGKDFLSLSDSQLRQELKLCLEEYMNEKMGGSDTKDSRFNYIYSRLLKVLGDIMDRLRSEFADSDFEPCDFELSIRRDGDVKPFTLELERGTVQIRGIIDRVDKMDMDGKRFIRVVDYKTGGKTFELSDVLEGLNMQMLLYLISVWRNGEGEYKDIIPAGILYFPAKMSTVNVEDRGDGGEALRENRYRAGKMNGMIVDDYDMVSHMDKQGKGLFIPVTADKRTGKIKGKFISLYYLERLGEKMDGVIRAMAQSIQDGIIPARPVYGSSYTDVCDWCDYREICLEENPEKRYIRKIPHDECLELLREKEETE
ncbi:MAG: PD-(D/E)XK nuclease family protein [Clostridia bacterium]|nr:PD-(D/E)XK nuclease family protein [Clostridia bacterium]